MEPEVTPEAAPVAAAPEAPASLPAPAGDAPWSADLAGLFPDEAVRGQVDGYLREKVQPRVTKMEQDLAQYRPAHQLYDDFQSSPLDTTLNVVEQLFEGADLEAVKAALGIAPEAAPATPPVTPAQADTDPRLKPALDDWEAREQQRVWDEQIAPLKAQDARLTDEILAPFVVGSGGDFEKAFSAYQAHQAQQVEALKALGWSPPPEFVAPPAPSTLGAGEGAAAAAPPPIAKKYASVSDALDDVMDDLAAQRAAAPATI